MASCYSTARLIIFLVVLLFITEIAQFCLCANSSTNNLACIETERKALLKFKQSFKKDPSSSYRLSSWKGNHCCQWEGVGCNVSTAHVINLDLSSRDIDEVLETEGVISSSLQELEYLSYLDLSGNNFQATPIPMFFGSMEQLRYLNLSSSQFGGRVPTNLGNLTNLRILDLSTEYSSGDQLQLYVDGIDWISQLSSLQHLDMSGVSMLKAKNLMQVLNMLPSLLQLRLHDCGLDDNHIGDDFQNVTSIRVLDLSSNDIHLVPLWFGKLKNLEYVNLASNSLSGPIPNVFQNMTDSITELELSDNSFDSVPLWFGKLTSLVHLNLAFNRLKGPIPNALQNMTDIRILDLSHNNLSSSIPTWLSTFKRLVHVNLASNNFTSIQGSLTPILRDTCELKSLVVSENNFHGEAFGQHSRGHGNSSGCIRYDLEKLDLSTNKFNGSLPSWLGQFKNLKLLDLDWNAFYGPIPPSIGNLSNLTRLDLSENDLSGTVPENFGQLVNLQVMDLSNNNLSGRIPDNLGQLVNIQTLDLSHNSLNEVSLECFGNVKLIMDFSYNSLKGTISSISKWFSRPVQTSYLDISSNLINGTIPENIGYMMPLEYLLVADNKIEGSIPNSVCEIETLYILDLSRNKLSGSIPNCVWKGNSLDLIDLSFNELTGSIPNSIGNISTLEWLHLNKNNLHGDIPLALKNCKELIILDLGENQLSGTIPSWTGETFLSLQILRLRQNKFNGDIPSQLCQLLELQILDLGDNNLTGSIPHCIGDLIRMRSPKGLTELPFTDWNKEDVNQVIKGRELDYANNLKYVVNMDLSSNNLVGAIPDELTTLSGLFGLNLSHNHFVGVIPSKIGEMHSLESLDFCDNQLSGSIPKTMSTLTSLAHLNLSYNKFSGPIPQDNQFLTFDTSIYAGNPNLCGDPLPNRCPGDHESSQINVGANDEDCKETKTEKVLFYLVIATGFASGFWGFVGVLFFMKSWRHAYFQYIDDVLDNIYVEIAVKVARMKKRVERKGLQAD
ncbi:Leucine-rich repeat receptor protein kinase [Quillaja saponaria]|uniref:Leucine-rich repeat receptor protein kinase n=1 Tax=Quillaja saponaria TaxID=32244 RepID=A0AAD7PW16_QUISA|nr:Leucine-rich repeat receptor protein kinase [Quillaja saponaria]